MRKIHTFLFAFCAILSLRSQIPTFNWVAGAGDINDDVAYSVAYDQSGNVFTTGYFQGTVDFDPGVGTFTMTSNGSWDIFVTKLSPTGNFLWAKQIGSSTTDVGYSIAADGFGSVYFTGYFSGTADFDPGASTFTMASSGGNDIFICKLDGFGNFSWAKKMGALGDDQGMGLTVNSVGTVYTTGRYELTVDFDPGAATYTLGSVGLADVFVSKLDASGNFVFAKSIGSSALDVGYSIKTDGGGNIVYGGFFGGMIDMDPGAGTFTMNVFGGGNYDAFVNKLDGNGNFTWSKQIGGTGYEAVYSIAIDFFNAVHLTGEFGSAPADFDPSAGTFTMTASGPSDAFICKLDVAGAFNWAKQIGGGGPDAGSSISLNNSGIYTTGSFAFTTDFDPGAGTYTIASAGSVDAFVLKLDVSGNFLFASPIGGTGIDNGIGIAADASNNIYICGNYGNTVDFDPTAATSTLSSIGMKDIFTTKWGQCIKPNAPTITTNQQNLYVCVSGSVVLTASPNGTITWYTSASGGSPVGTGNTFTTPVLTITTTYYAEALTCAPSASRTPVTITISGLPTLSIAVTNTLICSNGGYTKLTASGAATYTWSGGVLNGFNFSPTVTANYTVIGTSALGCTNSAVTTVSVYPQPSVTIISTNSLICAGENATLTANGLSTYTWAPSYNSGTIEVISPTITTTYTLIGNDIYGCYNSIPFTQSVSPCIGIKEISSGKLSISVYPNPSSGIIDVNSSVNTDLMLINSLGQTVGLISLNENNNRQGGFSSLSSGVYFLITDGYKNKIVVISH